MEIEEKIVSSGDTTADESRVYELGYILVPSIPEEKVVAEVDTLHALLVKNHAEIVSFEHPILIDLAYSMTKVVSTQRSKHSRGYFGWVKFTGTPEGLTAIKKVLDLSSTVLRYMIVKTVRENTLLNGKMMFVKEEEQEIPADVVAEEDGIVDMVEKPIPDLIVA
jgi:ribosomal protein S6